MRARERVLPELPCGHIPMCDFKASAHEAGKCVVSKSLTADALRRVDEQIENLQRQRERLVEKLKKARGEIV